MSYPESALPLCPVCKKPVLLETAKVDSAGRAIHSECYLRALHDHAADLDSQKPN